MEEKAFTRYEISRILGARALQIAMNAPLLVKIEKDDLEKINYDALKIAEVELDSNILPISIKRPLPKKKEEKLKRVKETLKVDVGEEQEEEEIAKAGEIMELANPEDEQDEELAGEEASSGSEEE